MNLFLDALAWIFSPERLTGNDSIPAAFAAHLAFTVIAVLIANVAALLAGLWSGSRK